MITLQQLQVFCAVAEHGSFTRAADALYLTQPAVTFHVRSLERQLNLQLIEHRGRRVFLTAAGEYLWGQAMGVLGSVDMIERHVRQFAEAQMGKLKIGATLTVGDYVIMPILHSFHERYPGIHLSLEIGNTARMEQALLARELDLALVEWLFHSPGIADAPFMTDELVVAVPRNHRLAGLQKIDMAELETEPFVMREQGSGTRALALKSLGAMAERIDVVLELSRDEAIKHAVIAGLGITIISQTTVKEELLRGDIVAVRIKGQVMQRDFSLAWLEGQPGSPATRAFVQHLETCYPRLQLERASEAFGPGPKHPDQPR